jgi:hypothetical protein
LQQRPSRFLYRSLMRLAQRRATAYGVNCRLMSKGNQEPEPYIPPESLFKRFRQACSLDRFAPYKVGRSEIDALALYVWNVALSEAFYPSLQNLEIALRNRINTAITVSYKGDAYWFDNPDIVVEQIAKDSVEEAKDKIEDRGDAITPFRVVSELNLGFWSGLLGSKYDVAIWRRSGVLPSAFPYMPSGVRSRERARKEFSSIKKFRNKVFHHEPIWQLDLEAQHKSIYEAMGWLDPSLTIVTKVMDRFPEVNSAAWRNKIKEELMKACPIETKVLLASRRESITITLEGIHGDRFFSSGS